MGTLTAALLFWMSLSGAVPNQARLALTQQAGSLDKAGPYLLKADLAPEQREGTMAEIRDWLWRHWHEQRAGQLQIKDSRKDGEYESTYKVEPDSKGDWQVNVIVRQTSTDPWYPSQKYQQNFDIHAYTVERYFVSHGPGARRSLIPADAAALATRYRLQLKDKGGKIVHEF